MEKVIFSTGIWIFEHLAATIRKLSLTVQLAEADAYEDGDLQFMYAFWITLDKSISLF